VPRIVLMGIGIFPHRLAGDKNYCLDLRRELESAGFEVVLVSIAGSPRPRWRGDVIFLGRAFHGSDDARYALAEDGRPIGYNHMHGMGWQTLELAATILKSARVLRGISSDGTPTVWHWLDSPLCLPVLRYVVRRDPIVVTSLSSTRRGAFGSFVRGKMLGVADAVLVGSRQAASVLRGSGCGSPVIEVVPWACADSADEASPTVRSGPARLVWSGFIQRIREPDMLAAAKLALEVTALRSDIEFVFSLKPEFYETSYQDDYGSSGVTFVRGDTGFKSGLGAFDGLFSPVLDSRSALAPPLTWIEAMSAGTPVVTTKTPGVDEHFCHGLGGLAFEDWAALRAWLLEAPVADILRAMRPGVRECHRQRYTLERAAAGHIGVYERVIGDRVPR
jgi:hypothetical protein